VDQTALIGHSSFYCRISDTDPVINAGLYNKPVFIYPVVKQIGHTAKMKPLKFVNAQIFGTVVGT
jgi:hypothetical protein